MSSQGPLTGQVLGGKYLLGEVIGKGGFGLVYVGRHQSLNRPQAVKVLHEHFFLEPKFRRRFLREAQILATLDHHYILHIYDFGMEEHGLRAYLVMPYISKGTFRDLLNLQGPLNTE